MKKYKAVKYRIYPDKEQRDLILKTFGCSRFVYNYMLERSIEAHKNGESFCTRNSFSYLLTSIKKEFLWLKGVDSKALESANNNLAAAFSNFFKKNTSFPRFHKKKISGSYRTRCINGNIALLDRGIKLPKLGNDSEHLLAEEGKQMKNCVRSYYDFVKSGSSFIFHVDYKRKGYCCELKMNEGSPYIAQLLGACNSDDVPKALVDKITKVIGKEK